MLSKKRVWEKLYLKPEYRSKSLAELGTSIHQSLENYYISLLKTEGQKTKDQKKD